MTGAKGTDTFPSETASGSPGAILRRCREFHGITLEEAADTTKIGVTHLKALEEDRIHDFANKAYLKGFLRIYATYLGLNSDDVARMYEKLFGDQSENIDSARTKKAASHPRPRIFSLKKLAFPAFFLLLIIITATFFKRPPAPVARQQPQPVAAVAVSPEQNMSTAAVQKMQSSVQISTRAPEIFTRPVKPETKAIEQLIPEITPPEKSEGEQKRGFILKIRATQNGTLSAAVDDSGSELYELAAGDIIEWKAEKKVVLETSNSSSIDVEVDGKPHKLPAVPGKPLYVELDADGVKR